jgi:HK97 family phage major capsid protein
MGTNTMTQHNLARAPETKSAGNHAELADAFDEFMTTFEAFKDGNDRRLAELESKGADALTSEKVDRIGKALDEQKRALDDLALKRARPALGRDGRAGDAPSFDCMNLQPMRTT